MSTTSEQLLTLSKTDADPPKPQRGVFKRFTSKLRNLSQSHIPDVVLPATAVAASLPPSDAHACSAAEKPTDDPSPTLPPPESHPDKMKRKITRKLLSLPSLPPTSKSAPVSASGMYASLHHEMENDWSSAAKREAALRASGLVPAKPKPGRDLNGYRLPLSELETQLDDRYAVMAEIPEGDCSSPERDNEDSEAKRIREEWLRRNIEPEVVKENEQEKNEEREEESVQGEALVSEPEPERKSTEVTTTAQETRPQNIRGGRRTNSIDSANEVFHDALEMQDQHAGEHPESSTN